MNSEELVRQYAKAWNNLDIGYLEPYLSEDFVYDSQFVFSSITSKAEYLDYLSGKFSTIKKANEEGNSLVCAEIGYYLDKPCIIMLQIHNVPKATGMLRKEIINNSEKWLGIKSKAIETVLLVECKDGKITKGDMCMIPSANDVKRTWEIPL